MNLQARRLSLLVLIFTGIFTGCDEADELTEFDISESFTTTINVNIPGDSQSEASIDEFAGIDIINSPEIEDNYNLIQSISINSITYEIDDFSGFDGAVVSNASFTLNGDTISIDDVTLEDADNNNTIFVLEDEVVFNSISQMLLNSSELSIGVSGTVNGTPVQFNVIVNFDITVTVDVL
jgi:hypothetical protein